MRALPDIARHTNAGFFAYIVGSDGEVFFQAESLAPRKSSCITTKTKIPKEHEISEDISLFEGKCYLPFVFCCGEERILFCGEPHKNLGELATIYTCFLFFHGIYLKKRPATRQRAITRARRKPRDISAARAMTAPASTFPGNALRVTHHSMG
jgi:hypothetical protein